MFTIICLTYWAEIIRETGKSRVFTTGQEEDINALAGDFGVTYDWQTYAHPRFSVEYAFGSRDSDRINVTDTQNGNAAGDDENFLYFGYLETGYALAPRLSNLHFYKVGLSLTPFEKHPLLKKRTVDIDYYRYYKFAASGGIFDLDATDSSNDIGREVDVRIKWQILSDLSCTLEYGYFKPEHAYPSATNDSEEYFSLSTILTF